MAHVWYIFILTAGSGETDRVSEGTALATAHDDKVSGIQASAPTAVAPSPFCGQRLQKVRRVGGKTRSRGAYIREKLAEIYNGCATAFPTGTSGSRVLSGARPSA